MSNCHWLTLFWPATNNKACTFNSLRHKKCYWRDFDVADGKQAFAPSAELLLKNFAKLLQTPEKWRNGEVALRTTPVQLNEPAVFKFNY